MIRRTLQPVRKAFTIVELMIVIAVIGVLMSILLVAFGGVRRSAQQATAQRFVATVGQAIEAFERELGYLPPLLAYDIDLGDQPLLGNQPTGNQRHTTIVPEARWQSTADLRSAKAKTRFGSEFTLAVYLLGTGDINGDELVTNVAGANDAKDDGQAGPGFRDPGPDRSWGGAARRQTQIDNNTASKIGRTFGPFLDLSGLSNHLTLDQRTGLFKITDTWGQPLRYYTGWPTKIPASPNRLEPNVDHIPVELRTADAVEHHLVNAEPDLGLEVPVLNARYMVVSAGPPIFFGSNNAPIPLFGDRRRDGAGIDFSSLDGLTMPTHDPAQTFLTSFGDTEESRRYLLEDLRSNVRHLP